MLTDDVVADYIQEFSVGLVDYVEQHAPDLFATIQKAKAFDDAWESKLQQTIKDFKGTLKPACFLA